jgi:hypothetical protein
MPNHTVSTNVDTMLRAADNAAIRTAIGLGQTDAPTFLNFTATGAFSSAPRFAVTSDFLIVPNNSGLGLAFSGGPVLGGTNTTDSIQLRNNGGTAAARLAVDANEILAQRNGTNAQTFRVYNTYTDASNFEVGYFSWGSNVCSVGTHASGTGSFRKLALIGNGIDFAQANVGVRWSMTTAGNFIATSDNQFDIGASGANRPRNIYVGSSIVTPGATLGGGSGVVINSSFDIGWSGSKSSIYGGATDGVIKLSNYAGNDFNRLQLGGTTSAFPAIKRNGTGIDIRLADDSGFAPLAAAKLELLATAVTGVRENLLKCTVSDSGNDAFYMANATVADGSFVPGFIGAVFSSAGRYCLNLSGQTTSVNDTGTAPIVAFQACITNNAADPNNGTLSAVGTRPLFTWVNYTTTLMQMSANGNLGIGTITPASKLDISDTTLSGSGSLAGSALNIAQTWNTTGTPSALKLNVTDTASNAASNLMDLQVAGVSKFKVNKAGRTTIGNVLDLGFGVTVLSWENPFLRTYSPFSCTYLDISSTGVLLLHSDASGVFAQKNLGNRQTFRIYNATDTNAGNPTNYDRGIIEWTSGNILKIGTENAGTYTLARPIDFVTGGVVRMSIAAAGAITYTNSVLSASGISGALGTTGVEKTYINQNSLRIFGFDSGLFLLGAAFSNANPAIKRNGTELQAKLADDSAFTFMQGKLKTDTAYTATVVVPTGFLTLYDSTGTAYRVPCVV